MIWINDQLYHMFPWLCLALAGLAVMAISSPLKWPAVLYLAAYGTWVLRRRWAFL